jgi:hypothetical protein
MKLDQTERVGFGRVPGVNEGGERKRESEKDHRRAKRQIY